MCARFSCPKTDIGRFQQADARTVLLLLVQLFVMGTLCGAAFAVDERTAGVYVALCDNANQGIIPVPEAIGKGDDPDRNLYWGSAEGFQGVFGKSAHWKKESASEAAQGDVMRTCTYRHASGKVVLTAFAYRGSAIRACIEDFEKALQQGTYDLVVYIGHNGLMDFSLSPTAATAGRAKTPECIVLCCKSQAYFQERIESVDAKPILLTTQLMYPGAFILHDVLEEWILGSSAKAYRTAAGRSYAANQKIAQKAALGVFADLESALRTDKRTGGSQ